MKNIVAVILASAAVFFMLTCNTFDSAPKFPNMVADVDPFSVGTIEAVFDRVFSANLNKLPVEVIFHPRHNTVSLEFRYELMNYRQYWDALGRQQFASALNMYKKDYADRNLGTKYRKTRAVYGKVNGRVEWETFKFSKTRIAYPVIDLGYRFKRETPFFATNMRSAKEENSVKDGSDASESLQITMYFTRAQADDLVALFDQSYLMGLLDTKEIPEPEEIPVETDFYKEWD